MFRLALAALCATGCFAKPPAPTADDAGGGSGVFERSITINITPSSDLADFPVSVLFTGDEGVRTHIGSASNIRFVDANGVELASEVVMLLPDFGMLDAWVRLPVLSAAGPTQLTLQYGPGVAMPPARGVVWPTSGWRGVWHFAETIEGEARDSTVNGLHLDATTTPGATVPMPTADGIVGYGLNYRDMPSNDQLCRAAGDPTLEVGTNSFTLEAWVRPTRLRGSYDLAVYKGGSSNGNPGYDMELGQAQWNTSVRDPSTTTAQLVQYAQDGAGYVNKWTHLAFVVDRKSGIGTTYVNGAMTDTLVVPTGTFTGSERLCFGENNYPMAGYLDEIRLHAVARSQAWLRTSYLNLGDRGRFLTIGAEQIMQ